MKTRPEDPSDKLPYETPTLRTIELAADEVLAVGCKHKPPGPRAFDNIARPVKGEFFLSFIVKKDRNSLNAHGVFCLVDYVGNEIINEKTFVETLADGKESAKLFTDEICPWYAALSSFTACSHV